MNPEQAWQAVLGQLQMEMPRASFDTWVRDTRFIGWEEGVFTVGARNNYARDWLDNRLLSTVSRLLAGMLNQSVEVRFVVDQGEYEENAIVDDNEKDDDLPVKEEAGQASNIVRARISLSEYEKVVKPSRKIVFPAYFLRHIPRIGPELAWLVIALRQITFLNHGKPIPGREIARWSGMSLRSFRRWSKRMGEIAIFADRRIEKVDNQRVTIYSVWADDACPLTPADTKSLTYALTDLLAKLGTPELAVNALIEMSSAELREKIFPEIDLDDSGGECVTINELVQWLGWEPELGIRLEQRIMAAFGLVVLTWHFVLNLLPVLDHGPAWMVTILRNLCYDGREQRTSTLLAPMTLGRMCGLKGKWMPATLSSWLRKPIVQGMALDENLGDRTLGAEKPHRYHVSFLDTILPEKPEIDEGSRASDTRVEGEWHQHRGQVAPGSRASDTPLNLLNLFNHLNQLQLIPNTPTNQPGRLEISLAKTTSNRAGGRVFSATQWVLSEILQRCRVNRKKWDEILGKTTAPQFLAYLLYAYSPHGKGIEDQIGFAITCATNLAYEPDQIFLHLAGLPPEELAHLLEQQYASQQPGSQIPAPELPSWFDTGMHELAPESVRALAQRIGDLNVFSSLENE